MGIVVVAGILAEADDAMIRASFISHPLHIENPRIESPRQYGNTVIPSGLSGSGQKDAAPQRASAVPFSFLLMRAPRDAHLVQSLSACVRLYPKQEQEMSSFRFSSATARRMMRPFPSLGWTSNLGIGEKTRKEFEAPRMVLKEFGSAWAMLTIGWQDASTGGLIQAIRWYYGVNFVTVSSLFIANLVGCIIGTVGCVSGTCPRSRTRANMI